MAGASVSTEFPVTSTGTLPFGFICRYCGVCVDPSEVELNDSWKGRSISSRTICGANEQEPGEKYRVGFICMELVMGLRGGVVMVKVGANQHAAARCCCVSAWAEMLATILGTDN